MKLRNQSCQLILGHYISQRLAFSVQTREVKIPTRREKIPIGGIKFPTSREKSPNKEQKNQLIDTPFENKPAPNIELSNR